MHYVRNGVPPETGYDRSEAHGARVRGTVNQQVSFRLDSVEGRRASCSSCSHEPIGPEGEESVLHALRNSLCRAVLSHKGQVSE